MSDTALAVVMPSVELVNGQIITTSLAAADYFGKAHRSVLRDIRALDCSPEFAQHNFVRSDYVDRSGRLLPSFNITRDGLVFLVMGWTGERAARKKEAYIAAFNAMEAALKLRPGELKVRAADLEHYRRCERELIRVQRYSLSLQRRVIRLQGRLLYARPVPAAAPAPSSQGELFARGAA